MDNRINKTAKQIIIRWLIDTNAHKKGEIATLTKKEKEYGGNWVDKEKHALVFSSHIRNKNICEIIYQC